MDKIIEKIKNEDRWVSLIDDCKAILVEGIWNYRLTLIKTYHLIGKRILEEKENAKKEGIYGEKIVQYVAQCLGKSPRTIWQAIQFAEKYPDINDLPEGKNISRHKICTKYLTEPKNNQHTCEWENAMICKICKKIKTI